MELFFCLLLYVRHWIISFKTSFRISSTWDQKKHSSVTFGMGLGLGVEPNSKVLQLISQPISNSFLPRLPLKLIFVALNAKQIFIPRGRRFVSYATKFVGGGGM